MSACFPVEQPVATASAKTIVVIDDGEDLVESIVLLLELEGYRAFGTGDGMAGIALVAQHRADLVVLDYMMPLMNGGEVGRRLRSATATCGVKILMCSGTPEPVVRDSFTGYDGYLAKPAFPEAFLQSIETLLALPVA